MASVLLLLLTSCFSAKPCVDTCDIPKLNIPSPEKVELDNISLSVKSDDGGKAFVKLTIEDYKKMSVNLQKILFYIKTQNKIISAYKKYYEEPNSKEK